MLYWVLYFRCTIDEECTAYRFNGTIEMNCVLNNENSTQTTFYSSPEYHLYGKGGCWINIFKVLLLFVAENAFLQTSPLFHTHFPDNFSKAVNFLFSTNYYILDECYSIPCQNDGTCIDEKLMFTWECPSNFRGILCEKGTCYMIKGK